jgi:membrane protein
MSHPHALSTPLTAGLLRRGRTAAFARVFAQEWNQADGIHLAAALAFYSVLSLAPFLLVVVAIAGYALGFDRATQYLLGQITDIAGAPTAQFVGGLIAGGHPIAAREGAKALIGLAVTLAGATAMFAELSHGLDRIFGGRDYGALGVVRTRALAFGLVIGVAVLAIVSLVLTAGVHAMLAHVGREDLGMAVLSAAGNEIVAFVVLTLAFGAIMRVLPRCPPRRRAAWIGGATASGLFVVGKFAIGWYLAHFALGSAYGAAGAILVVMLWIYWSSILFFVGAVIARIADAHERDREETDLELAGIA